MLIVVKHDDVITTLEFVGFGLVVPCLQRRRLAVPQAYTAKISVYLQRGHALHYSVDLRIRTNPEPVPLKLATKSP